MKSHYKIPTSLDKSYLEIEIVSKKADGSIRNTPMRVIVYGLFSFLLCYFIVTKEPVRSGTFIQQCLFILLWVVISVNVLRYDKTKKLYIEMIPALLEFIQKKNRVVKTRTTNNATREATNNFM